jgi:hypothetical protein
MTSIFFYPTLNYFLISTPNYTTSSLKFFLPITTETGSGFLKIAFKDIGEIDFIVGHSLTSSPTIPKTIENETVQLETIPEIITKKIYHRGASIRPRDIFDIAAASEKYADSIISALRDYPEKVAATLRKMDQLNPEFVESAISALAIKDQYKPVAATAFERAKTLLSNV